MCVGRQKSEQSACVTAALQYKIQEALSFQPPFLRHHYKLCKKKEDKSKTRTNGKQKKDQRRSFGIKSFQQCTDLCTLNHSSMLPTVAARDLVFEDNVERMNDARQPAQDRQEDVDQHVSAATTLEKDSKRRNKDRYKDLDDIGRSKSHGFTERCFDKLVWD